MSILKINLRTLYQDDPSLESSFPFVKYYEYLNESIAFELRRGNDCIEPASFAHINSMEIKKALTFLITISTIRNNRIINLKYSFECENCGAYDSVEEEDLEEWTCYECDETINIKSLMQKGLVNLNVAFEIDRNLRMAMLEGFKFPSSNSKIIVSEVEGGPSNIDNFINIDKYFPEEKFDSNSLNSISDSQKIRDLLLNM